jgi:hypothetical protein
MYAQTNEQMQLLQSMSQGQFDQLQQQALWNPIQGAAYLNSPNGMPDPTASYLPWEYPMSGMEEQFPMNRRILPRPA